MTNRIAPRTVQALAASAAVLLLLTACSTGEGTTSTPTSSQASASSAPEETAPTTDVDDSAVDTDLTAAAAVVQTAVTEYPEATQVILSSTEGPMDIQYGAVSAYFVPSDATERVSGTVEVTDGAFTVSGTSVASGITYTIDQTGAITAE